MTGKRKNEENRIPYRVGHFHDLYLGHGIYIHWLRNALCKTIRLDLILSQPLSKPENALGALVSRLGERGTVNLPTMQEVGRAVDQLYGAFLSTDVSVWKSAFAKRLLWKCWRPNMWKKARSFKPLPKSA